MSARGSVSLRYDVLEIQTNEKAALFRVQHNMVSNICKIGFVFVSIPFSLKVFKSLEYTHRKLIS